MCCVKVGQWDSGTFLKLGVLTFKPALPAVKPYWILGNNQSEKVVKSEKTN